MAIIKKHAVHLFHGGFGDVTGDEKLKDYSILLYCRDSKGKKMILKTSTINGRVRDNLQDIIDSCAENEVKKIVMKVPMTPKQIARAEKLGISVPEDGVKNMALKPKQIAQLEKFGKPVPMSCANEKTLWIEAKVVPKKTKMNQTKESSVASNEEVEPPVDDEAQTETMDAGESKKDDWDVLVTEAE